MDIELNFEKRHRLLREIVETIILTVLMFLIIRMAIQNFYIDGFSMEPNFHNTELVLVDKWSYLFRRPARGDAIVFVAPPEPTRDYIKRVIGVPGDIITVNNKSIYVNGKLLKETYVDPTMDGNQGESFANRVVPPDTYFVLGDHRAESYDSRSWGCVPKQNIVGKAAVVYWPFGQDNTGLVPGVSAVFDNVPAPPAAQGLKKCPIITDGKKPIDPIYTTDLSTSQTPLSTPGNGFDLSTLFVLVLPGVFYGFHSSRNSPNLYSSKKRSRK